MVRNRNRDRRRTFTLLHDHVTPALSHLTEAMLAEDVADLPTGQDA